MNPNDFHLSWTLFWQVFILFNVGCFWIAVISSK